MIFSKFAVQLDILDQIVNNALATRMTFATIEATALEMELEKEKENAFATKVLRAKLAPSVQTIILPPRQFREKLTMKRLSFRYNVRNVILPVPLRADRRDLEAAMCAVPVISGTTKPGVSISMNAPVWKRIRVEMEPIVRTLQDRTNATVSACWNL